MNMPATNDHAVQPLPDGQQARLYPVSGLRAGKLQPRKRFPQAALQELAESIKRQGVVQPIIIRPIEVAPNVYALEIVAGERRWRAAQLAGLSHIPAIERELDDVQALELAVIENAQRQDLHPLEEAEGYAALLRAYGHEQADKQTADDLAGKIGKSRTFIYNRMKLLDLIPDGQDKFYEGAIPTTLAEKVARLPMAQQPLALADIIKDGTCLPVRDAEALLRRKYMLRLNTAPFSTKAAGLVPEAGPCIKCRKRTGCEPDLFADVEHNDTCTDPPCYQRKVAAHQALVKAKATKAGMQVIEGDNARALLKFGTTSDTLNGDYVYTDQPLKHLTDSPKSLADLLGTNLTPSALFEHPKDLTLRHIVLVTKATDALRAAGLLVHDPAAEQRARKAAQQPDLTTTVATPREQPEPATNTRVIQPADATDGQAEAGPVTADESESPPSDAELHFEWQWRQEAFRRVHNTLQDYGYVPTDVFKRQAVLLLGAAMPAHAWALLADLWGWDHAVTYTDGSRELLLQDIEDMDANQLDILMADLLMLSDVHPERWVLPAAMADVASSRLVQACEDADINVDWRTLSKAPYPSKMPPPAGDEKGVRQAEGDASPSGNHSQAPQGAQHDEGAQPVLAHWVGQHVKVKGAKRLGQISEIDASGDLLVAFHSGEKRVRNLHSYRSHELEVLPDQIPPKDSTAIRALTPQEAWPFPSNPKNP